MNLALPKAPASKKGRDPPVPLKFRIAVGILCFKNGKVDETRPCRLAAFFLQMVSAGGNGKLLRQKT